MRGGIHVTESRGGAGADLDLLSTAELASLMNREDATAVVAISASGRTPYTVGAARAAAAAGAFTACVVCNSESELAGVCADEIVVSVGSELVAGSTRLKGGTAQKLVLNMLSTISMIRL